VMDYIAGESLSHLARMAQSQGLHVPAGIAVRIMTDVLAGLHSAHELVSDRGLPLGVVHRDVSPQNLLVGADGLARLIDFGVAKAAGRIQTTRDGQLKGKFAYMAPEQIQRGKVDRRADIYAAGTVLWETLVGRRAFEGDEAQVIFDVLARPVPPPSSVMPALPAALDAAIMKSLDKDPSNRFATAREMSDALAAAIRPATAREVEQWVHSIASASLRKKAQLVAEIESMRVVGAVSLPADVAESDLSTETSADPPDNKSESSLRGVLTVSAIMEPPDPSEPGAPMAADQSSNAFRASGASEPVSVAGVSTSAHRAQAAPRPADAEADTSVRSAVAGSRAHERSKALAWRGAGLALVTVAAVIAAAVFKLSTVVATRAQTGALAGLAASLAAQPPTPSNEPAVQFDADELPVDPLAEMVPPVCERVRLCRARPRCFPCAVCSGAHADRSRKQTGSSDEEARLVI